MKNSDKLTGLLYSNPNKFIVEAQPIIKFAVNYYKTNNCQNCDYEEMLQNVNYGLLEKKIKLMQKNYTHKYKLTTYLIQIVKNLCFDYFKKQNKSHNINNSSKQTADYHEVYEANFAIESSVISLTQLGSKL